MTDETMYDFTEIVYGGTWIMDIPDGDYFEAEGRGGFEHEPAVIWNRFIDPETGDEWAFTTNERDAEHSLE